MAHQDAWETKFNELLSELDDPWNLEIVSNVVQESGWLPMQYTGKATFECSTATCNNRWTSINAGARINYRQFGSNTGQHGKVKLFLGGQKCLKCKGVFESSIWHNLYIEGAITKLLNKVKQKFFALNVPTNSTTGNTYIQADMSAPHQTSLCEFCALGICQHGQQNDIDSIASQFEHLDVDDDYDNVSDEDYDDVWDDDYDDVWDDDYDDVWDDDYDDVWDHDYDDVWDHDYDDVWDHDYDDVWDDDYDDVWDHDYDDVSDHDYDDVSDHDYDDVSDHDYDQYDVYHNY
jgi:hypothetical protein